MKKALTSLLLICLILNFSSCKSKAKTKEAKKEQQTQQVQQEKPVQQEEQDVFVAEFLFNSENIVKDNGQKEFGTITGFELTKAMVTGWNLGNTFDATATMGMSSEMSWGQPHTEKEMIDGLAKSGIKTIRIPVSWHNHLSDKKHILSTKNGWNV